MTTEPSTLQLVGHKPLEVAILDSDGNQVVPVAQDGGAAKFAFANVAASQTDSQVVAAVAGKKIRVLALCVLAAATATNLTFNSKGGGAGTAISCLLANGANGGAVLPYSPAGWFETNASEALTATTGVGSTTGIQVVYTEVTV